MESVFHQLSVIHLQRTAFEEIVERQAAQGVVEALVSVQGIQVIPTRGIFLLDRGVEVEHTGLSQHVQAACHFAAAQGRAVRPSRHAHT